MSPSKQIIFHIGIYVFAVKYKIYPICAGLVWCTQAFEVDEGVDDLSGEGPIAPSAVLLAVHPTAGKVMDRIRIARSAHHTRGSDRGEIIMRIDAQSILLYKLFLTIRHEALSD